MNVLLPILAGISGVVVGAFLSRRNARQDHADKLLADALNDLVAAIADVATGDTSAQRRYAAAASRIALHGSPELVDAFHAFQLDANTGTQDGRRRLIEAVQAGRHELGRQALDAAIAAVMLFGPDGPRDADGTARQRDA